MYAQLIEKHRKDIKLFELYVTNLPPKIHNNEIVSFFSEYGLVKSAKVYDTRDGTKSFATVRFYDYQSMMKAYLRFGKNQYKPQQMHVDVSRMTLLICTYCSKVGHWKNQCKGLYNRSQYFQKKLSSNNYNKKDLNKSIDKTSYSYKSQSFVETEKNKTKQIFSQSDESLQYFCPELQQPPKVQLNDDWFFQQKCDLSQRLMKQQEQDETTNFDEQSQIIQEKKMNLTFVNINAKNSFVDLMTAEENKKLQNLWASGWFQQISDQVGPFVRIKSASIDV